MIPFFAKSLNLPPKPLNLGLGRRCATQDKWPYVLSGLQRKILAKMEPYTMTSTERVAVAVGAVRHLEAIAIERDIEECGVWRGGSSEVEQPHPRLAKGGIQIIDGYGSWQGARKAVDEDFAARTTTLQLCRIDASARIGVKP
jgi:hypothetical protein